MVDEEVLTIYGNVTKAIQAATDEFNKHGLDLSQFEIVVTESNMEYEITFQYALTPPGYRGSPKGYPGIVVYVNKVGLTVNKTHFVR